MATIQDRVRKALAEQEKARKAAAYKAGESARRSQAARLAAETRADKKLFAYVDDGDIEWLEDHR